jgi:dipeptidyl aminopeptidase/acylaminoacyl peptidase
VTTPTLILHGEKDARVPVSQATAFHRALQAAGARHELVVYPREPHGIEERAHQIDVLRRVRDWFLKYVPVG